ncbi:MAG: DinB family protein [Acidobacteriota bacterium]|nr:DinB family protein [Acidobacteriota bacterium]
MDEKTLFTKFWLKEAKTTRNVLARIPDGSDYKPDPKSKTAKEIAWQIVAEEKMIIEALEKGQADWAPGEAPATMKEVLDVYDAQAAEMGRRWDAVTPAKWDGTLEFFGQSRPASPMAWSFLFDIVHHRGQITTYLRAMGSTVPQIYGPSADEPM